VNDPLFITIIDQYGSERYSGVLEASSGDLVDLAVNPGVYVVASFRAQYLKP
jgi:hypothetical protein